MKTKPDPSPKKSGSFVAEVNSSIFFKVNFFFALHFFGLIQKWFGPRLPFSYIVSGNRLVLFG
jgi:hypothetical protein